MNLDLLVLPAVIVLFLTATVLIISWDWRISILSLGIQYLCLFVLISLTWPMETAAVKVVAGWIAAAVLGIALLNLPQADINGRPVRVSEFIFRLIAAILAGLFAYTGGARLVFWLPEMDVQAVYGAMILISLGLLHLGLTNQPLRVVIGLLTMLSGFEILYAALESSILITGLLATVTLGLAMVGVYLLTAPALEDAN